MRKKTKNIKNILSDIDFDKIYEPDEAVKILSKSKKGSSELKILGKHPDTGEELVLKEGRYGPYISDGKVNAALKSDNGPNSITLEEATELINLKRAAPKRPRKKRQKKK